MNKDANSFASGLGSSPIDRVTAKEAAGRLAVSVAAVEKHAKRHGLRKGIDGKWDWATLSKSVEEGRTLDDANPTGGRLEAIIRKTEAEADLLEIRLKIAEGEYVDRSAVSLAWNRTAAVVKTELMAVGMKVGPQCEGQPAPVIIELITKAIGDALRHLEFEPAPPEDAK